MHTNGEDKKVGEDRSQRGEGVFIDECFVFIRLMERVLIKSMGDDLCLSVVVDDEILIMWDQN